VGPPASWSTRKADPPWPLHVAPPIRLHRPRRWLDNRYLQANAKALGFSNYSQQKAERIAARHIFVAEKKAERFGPRGVLTPQARMTINQIIAKYVGEDMTDRSIGGPLDRYLRELGRRTGQETWPVGETNGRAVQAVA
jgi:hypothetical protein